MIAVYAIMSLLILLEQSTPILTVHDSFIVPIGEEDRLNQLMKEAFEDVTNKVGIEVKYNQNSHQDTAIMLMAHRIEIGISECLTG